MRTYATAELIGTRSHHCDAAAVSTAHAGTRAYVLLDGIGSSDEIREWTRAAARRLARTAARRGDAEAGLRAVYAAYAAEREGLDPDYSGPKAAAVVAVAAPGRPLTLAWCGDARAYVLVRGNVTRLTADHNLRRVFPPTDLNPYGGNRNRITSALGASNDDDAVRNFYGHPAIESATRPAEDCRLLLASDGAYEPLEDAGEPLAAYLVGAPGETARNFVQASVARARIADPDHVDNATVLVADLRP